MEIIRTILEIIAILAILYGFTHEAKVVALEKKMWRNFKSFLRRQLRKSKRIVAWAEKPAKHGKPDAEFIAGQVKVFGDVWE